jgi:hypothetical protein
MDLDASKAIWFLDKFFDYNEGDVVPGHLKPIFDLIRTVAENRGIEVSLSNKDDIKHYLILE